MMIKIEFTCLTCGATEDITENAIEGKTIVPVCNVCYETFEARKEKLVNNFKLKLTSLYKAYGIQAETFNAAEEIADLR